MKLNTVKVTNPGTRAAAVRAYGGLEGIAPKRSRICKLTDEAAKAAEKVGLVLKAVKADTPLGYVEDAPEQKPRATGKQAD